jgi:hypothetical protein
LIPALAWVAVIACGGQKPDVEATAESVEQAATEPAADEVVATEAQEAMYKALSARDDGPSCEAVEGMSETPVEDLVWLTEFAEMPPWVGMRAATCLISGHAEEVADLLCHWVTDPELAGFGALVLGNLGLMPIELAVELARLALTEGPDPEAARERIARHDDPALQALLEE